MKKHLSHFYLSIIIIFNITFLNGMQDSSIEDLALKRASLKGLSIAVAMLAYQHELATFVQTLINLDNQKNEIIFQMENAITELLNLPLDEYLSLEDTWKYFSFVRIVNYATSKSIKNSYELLQDASSSETTEMAAYCFSLLNEAPITFSDEQEYKNFYDKLLKSLNTRNTNASLKEKIDKWLNEYAAFNENFKEALAVHSVLNRKLEEIREALEATDLFEDGFNFISSINLKCLQPLFNVLDYVADNFSSDEFRKNIYVLINKFNASTNRDIISLPTGIKSKFEDMNAWYEEYKTYQAICFHLYNTIYSILKKRILITSKTENMFLKFPNQSRLLPKSLVDLKKDEFVVKVKVHNKNKITKNSLIKKKKHKKIKSDTKKNATCLQLTSNETNEFSQKNESPAIEEITEASNKSINELVIETDYFVKIQEGSQELILYKLYENKVANVVEKFTYSENIKSWFSDPQAALLRYGYLTKGHKNYTPAIEDQEEAIARHTFPYVVDRYLDSLGRDSRILGEMKIKDRRMFGIFGYAKNEKNIYFHRCFTKQVFSKVIIKLLEQGKLAVDLYDEEEFPPLQSLSIYQ